MPTPLLDERGQSHKIIIPCILDNKGVHTFARFVMNVERTVVPQLYDYVLIRPQIRIGRRLE